jgi:predicted nucleic-acid-binding protein
MIALDTNVLIRLIIDDKEAFEQCQLAKIKVEQATSVYIANIVLLEVIWVLESRYKFSKSDIIIALNAVLSFQKFKFDRKATIIMAINIYETSSVSFNDCLIFASAEAKGLELFTFDKKLIKVMEKYGLAKIR